MKVKLNTICSKQGHFVVVQCYLYFYLFTNETHLKKFRWITFQFRFVLSTDVSPTTKTLVISIPCHWPAPEPFFFQSLCIMQKMSYFSPLLCVCLDVCVLQAIGLAQLSPLLLSHPFLTLWGGSVVRASLLVLLIFTYPGSIKWMSSFKGLQNLGVLCFHFPVYITLLWALGQPTVEELWAWHSWERVRGFVYPGC